MPKGLKLIEKLTLWPQILSKKQIYSQIKYKGVNINSMNHIPKKKLNNETHSK